MKTFHHRGHRGTRRKSESLLVAGMLMAILLIAQARAQNQADPPKAQEQNSSQDQPPKSDKKDEGSNPAQAAAEKTKNITIQAAEATKKLGEATFGKVRDWESGWLTGPYVGRDRELLTVTGRQRQQIYLQQTFTTPSAYFKRMFVAGVDQLREAPVQWGDGWGAYGERFASREGQFIAANSLAAAGNAALRYEPRYDQCRCRGFWPRTRHALVRNFLTYDQSETEMRPQWALYGGAFGGGMIAAAWKPGTHSVWEQGGVAVLSQAGFGALQNFFTEFAGDINRKLGAKR